MQLITRIKYTERSRIITKCLNHSYDNVFKFTKKEHLNFLLELTFSRNTITPLKTSKKLLASVLGDTHIKAKWLLM